MEGGLVRREEEVPGGKVPLTHVSSHEFLAVVSLHSSISKCTTLRQHIRKERSKSLTNAAVAVRRVDAITVEATAGEASDWIVTVDTALRTVTHLQGALVYRRESILVANREVNPTFERREGNDKKEVGEGGYPIESHNMRMRERI